MAKKKLEQQLAELEDLHLQALRDGDEDLAIEIAKEGIEIEKDILSRATPTLKEASDLHFIDFHSKNQ